MTRLVPASPPLVRLVSCFLIAHFGAACPAAEKVAGSDPDDTRVGADQDAPGPPIDSRDVAETTTDALTTPTETVAASETDTTEPTVPGELGAPCDEPADCFSGYCLAGRDHRYCSRTCTSTCPNGWGCRQNVEALPDIAFVCMPPWPTLCTPCRSNADCVVDFDATPHACIPTGDDGAFCGAACASDADCPDDAFCSHVEDIAGNPTRQCVPTTGACACSPPAIAARAATDCAVGNELGRCPGERVCAESGLTSCDARTPEIDICDGVDSNCDGRSDEAFVTSPCTLANEFGTCPGTTRCAGSDGERCEGKTPVAEACNGQDDDCDGETDEAQSGGCAVYFLDTDGDTFGTGSGECLCRPLGSLTATIAGDCDDHAKKIHPAGDEACNGQDDDCDGHTDEAGANGCTVFHRDGDQDDFGDPTLTLCLCAPEPPFDTRDASDCDDEDATARPSALERCNAQDDDCDGQTDELSALGCTIYFTDVDGDSFGVSNSFRCACAATDAFTATRAGDCDDSTTSTQPLASEHCGNAHDDDCDGQTDEPDASGCVTYYRDADRDGFGLDADRACLCAPAAPYDTTVAGDCADLEPGAHPGLPETCDRLDNDCDGTVDEPGADGCATYFQDRDKDGRGTGAVSACLCTLAFPFTAQTTDDCDDSNPFIGPDGIEICNGLDDDCDAATDEGVTDQCSLFYRDIDQDGWGVLGDADCLCRPDIARGFTTNRTGDCDDAAVAVYPLADELCNGTDDDCDGATDEAPALGCVTYYKDADQDGAGLASDTRCLCSPLAPYTALLPDDCDDTSAAVHPGATESCNMTDDDCDTLTDESGAAACDVYLRDTDGDGFGIAFDVSCLCAPTGTYRARTAGDCDDLEPAVSPGATEICDGRDNDCNGVADDPDLPGCTVFYRDVDGDTFGDASQSQCLCAPQGTFTATRADDCADLSPSVRPSGSERCNAVDDDCDGQTDETNAVGCTIFLADEDDDGFGVTGERRCECRAGVLYHAVLGGDCADQDPDINPSALEICNGKDDQCDGLTDDDDADGCVVRFEDDDRDTFGNSARERCTCASEPPWDAAVGGDCQDDDPTRRPDAQESCNGVDDDCDGLPDEVGALGCVDRYLDADGDKVGVVAHTLCLCAAQAAYSATATGDCDDGDARRAPGKSEICNGLDDDCDLVVDEPDASGCDVFWIDADRDTFGEEGSHVCLCAADPATDTDAIRGGDCDDDRAARNPSQIEVCDALDNDCDLVIDEASCGLPTTGWPTFMGNARRSGQLFTVEGPTASDSALLWKRQLDAARAFENSPVIDASGQIVILLGNRLWMLAPADGQTVWTTTLPSAAFARASPTARVGGTLVVPHGNAVSLVGPDGAILWTRDFGGAAGDAVVGAPLVDSSGRTFVVTNTHVRELAGDGSVAWATAITNTATHDSTPALGLDSRLYFASSAWVYSFALTGAKNWEYCIRATANSPCDTTKLPGASLVVNEVGRLLVPLGDTLYQLQDIQTGAQIDSQRTLVAGQAIYVVPAVYSDAIDSSNPAEWPVASPSGASGLQLLRAALTVEASKSLNKKSGPSSTPIVDARGNIFLGSNGASGQKAVFSARKNRRDSNRGDAWWSFTADGTDIDGAAALGTRVSGGSTIKFVVFGDSTGTIYSVGK